MASLQLARAVLAPELALAHLDLKVQPSASARHV
jgi:hypothetical protein